MSSRPLHIVYPAYNSNIVEWMFELERLRSWEIHGSTLPALFFQIKTVFHVLESLGSARIEGNRTTIDELVEQHIDGARDATEPLREIANIEDAVKYVEDEFAKNPLRRIDAEFICELHRLVVKNLRARTEGGEGDEQPGKYRSEQVYITSSSHIPPSPTKIDALMHELVEFINTTQNAREDLLRIAMAHHRFTFVHPFINGNGRVVRLITYAMLVRAGFRVSDGRIINPTAVFCHDRSAYMQHLSVADAGTDEALMHWCEFVIGGLRRELIRVYELLNIDSLREIVLVPALQQAHTKGLINAKELHVLHASLEDQIVNSTFFKRHYPSMSASSLSQTIALYKKKRLIVPFPNASSRKYALMITGPLLRHVIAALDTAGFLPPSRDM